MTQHNENTTHQQKKSEKIETLAQLERQIAQQETKYEQKKQELRAYKRQYAFSENVIINLKTVKTTIVQGIRSIGAYLLGRRNIKQLYSRTYKTKNAQNRLKSYKHNLYDLGFVDKSLAELKHLLVETKDPYLYRACAWELALWYANQPTQDDAQLALNYVHLARKKEKNQVQLRRLAIIAAECLERIGKLDEGKHWIKEAQSQEDHPDLYLAAANLETTLESRLQWINKALAMYDIPPIGFSGNRQTATYDDLITYNSTDHITNGPKVSVIFPVYNAASGIQVAIDAMLEQTWQNIELLIVDDCSTDDTVKLVQDNMKTDARIQLFSTPRNSGPYVARNIALNAATGEFVTVNDADDWSHAHKIATQVKQLINNRATMANSSEHSRLTESLKLYRRGTPGTYIFPNTSSIMFRREPVLEKLGSWDCVRFAADGEFKRRLIKTFGKAAMIDLKTGPLSLPRQSEASLTSSSKFGYRGFFMGARKEYVESLEHHHKNAEHLHYAYPPITRPFPVPEPMLPNRDKYPQGLRHVDVVIATDFYLDSISLNVIRNHLKTHKKLGLRTGFIQLSCYNVNRVKKQHNRLRELINGTDVQMLVYGESITCDLLLVFDPATLQEKQTYIPRVWPHTVAIIIDQLPMATGNRPDLFMYNFRHCQRHAMDYFGKRGFWYPANTDIQKTLHQSYKHETTYIRLAHSIWVETNHEPTYQERLEDWLL